MRLLWESSSIFSSLDLKVVLTTEWSVLLTISDCYNNNEAFSVWKELKCARHGNNTLNIKKRKPNCAFSIESSEHDDEKVKNLSASEQGRNTGKLEEFLGKTRKSLLALRKFLLWFTG